MNNTVTYPVRPSIIPAGNNGPPMTRTTYSIGPGSGSIAQGGTGTEFFWQVPTGVYVRIVRYGYVLDTLVISASRWPGYHMEDESGNILYLMRMSSSVAMSGQPVLNISPTMWIHQPNNTAVCDNIQMPDIWLWPGCKLYTDTFNLQSTDQYKTAHVEYEEIPNSSLYTYP